MQSKRPLEAGRARFMVLNVTRLRRRGFTKRCDAEVDPVWDWLCDPFCEACREPTFEKQLRITAGGNPPTADCGYKPRSATSMAEGSKSLPTMWTDQPGIEFCVEPCAVSAMPPIRPVRLFS